MEGYKKVYNFYIKDGEEDLIRHIMPEYFVDVNLIRNNVDISYAVKFLQNELNLILNSFLNGGFSYKGFIFHPFVKDVSKENISRIKRLADIAVFLNNNGYDFSASIKRYSSNLDSNLNSLNSKNFALILSELYKEISLIKAKASSIKKAKCRELDLSEYKKTDLGYLRPLNELKDYANKNLRRYLAGFYLHGSLATKDYVKGWSDVDTLCIVSKESIEDGKALLELRDYLYKMRHFFYKIDPLQHHGSIIISEYDMENYCNPYFSIPVFKYAKSFFKVDSIVSAKVRDYSSEALARAFWLVNYFRKLNIEKRFNLGSYDTKTLLHSITLFPTIYLQAKGTLVYKKFSFDIAKKDFKKESWEVIGEASSIRSNWKNSGGIPLIGLFARTNPLFYYQLNSRVLDLFKDIKKENKIDIKDIAEKILRLSEPAWSNIIKIRRSL